MAARIVTLLTDFGTRDWFVGVVHGVLLARAPEARLVDLTHEIPPGDIELAAFVLEVTAPDFPEGTIHVAVVDPGVGTVRRALCVGARGQLFVGPDNGILEHALSAPGARVRHVREERYSRLPVSRTFHTRDIFAPAAAHLCAGGEPADLGPEIHDPVRLRRVPRQQADGHLKGHVAYIDRFGNCITDLTEAELRRAFPRHWPKAVVVGIGAHTVQGLTEAYADVPVGTLLATIGSTGRLELAQYGAHAASHIGVAVGDVVWVRAGQVALPRAAYGR
jgi:S-adenosylmethionine hydrolase